MKFFDEIHFQILQSYANKNIEKQKKKDPELNENIRSHLGDKIFNEIMLEKDWAKE